MNILDRTSTLSMRSTGRKSRSNRWSSSLGAFRRVLGDWSGRGLSYTNENCSTTGRSWSERFRPNPSLRSRSMNLMRKREQKLVGPGGYVPAVSSVEIIAGYLVRVGFTDGREREVDLSRLVGRGPLTHAWRDPDYFARVFVHPEGRALTWPNGFDIDPCWLYEGAPQRSRTASP